VAYSHTSLSSAAVYLSLRLSDVGARFYTLAEQYAAIRESLRIWNVLTSHDRAHGFVTTAAPAAFYDLSTTLLSNPVDPTTLLRPHTITDAAIIAEIRFHLIEDNLPTDMFTTAQIVDAVQWKRDQFIADTAIVLTPRSDVIFGGGSGMIDYPDTVISVHRAVFRTASNAYIPLSRSDERSATAFNRLWLSPGVPRAYSMIASPALRLRLIPPPAESGTLNIYSASSGPTLDPTQAVSTILGIPDDLCWAVKWGAISTLLGSDGPGSDPERAQRADKLYALGVATALHIPTILHAEIDGVPVIPGAIESTDRFRSGWEGKTPGRPNTLSTVAPDLIALTPPPDSGAHTVSLEVVRNTLVPIAPTDQLQVGREQLDAVLGMAQWICTYKCGGDELTVADEYMKEFFAEAKTYAHQRSAASTALTSMEESGTLAEKALPLDVDASEGVRNADEIRQERNDRRRVTTQ
jgi:hypothetical protein